MVNLHFGLFQVISNQAISFGQSQQLITIDWIVKTGKFYTLVFYDNTVNKVHYLIINIPGTNLDAGKTLVEYTPPINESNGYSLEIFEQQEPIFGDLTDYELNFNSLSKRNNLYYLDAISFNIIPGTYNPADYPVILPKEDEVKDCGCSHNEPDKNSFYDEYLKTYAALKQISVPNPYTTDKMLKNIGLWKINKGF